MSGVGVAPALVPDHGKAVSTDRNRRGMSSANRFSRRAGPSALWRGLIHSVVMIEAAADRARSSLRVRIRSGPTLMWAAGARSAVASAGVRWPVHWRGGRRRVSGWPRGRRWNSSMKWAKSRWCHVEEFVERLILVQRRAVITTRCAASSWVRKLVSSRGRAGGGLSSSSPRSGPASATITSRVACVFHDLPFRERGVAVGGSRSVS